MALHLLVLGSLQLFAATFSDTVREHARCWLRTSGTGMPSDFLSRMALANVLRANIRGLAQNSVIALIQCKQITPQQSREKGLAQRRRAA